MNLAIDTSVNSVSPTRMIMYENTGYRFTRRKQHLLNIHISNIEAGKIKTGTTLPLQEPLIIDSQSDIYMDSFTTFNSDSNNTTANKHVFVMKIPEFNIQANSTNAILHNAIIVPNEDSNGTDTHKVHKGRKMNFIATVNPMKLTSITISLTDLAGSHISAQTGDKPTIIIEFVIVSKEYGDKKTTTS